MTLLSKPKILDWMMFFRARPQDKNVDRIIQPVNLSGTTFKQCLRCYSTLCFLNSINALLVTAKLQQVSGIYYFEKATFED